MKCKHKKWFSKYCTYYKRECNKRNCKFEIKKVKEANTLKHFNQ